MTIKGLLIIALLQVSQLALAQTEVIADATVTRRVLKLQADVSDVENSPTVVVTNIRLVDANDAAKISYFSAHPTKETLNTTTGQYTLIENTSEYICATLNFGKAVPNSRVKSDKIYAMMGEFIASSDDGTDLKLVGAGSSFDKTLLAVSCQKNLN